MQIVLCDEISVCDIRKLLEEYGAPKKLGHCIFTEKDLKVTGIRDTKVSYIIKEINETNMFFVLTRSIIKNILQCTWSDVDKSLEFLEEVFEETGNVAFSDIRAEFFNIKRRLR